jgi:hypothetical protein
MILRRSKRVLNELRAELLLKEDRHEVIIENFSRNGMCIRYEPGNTAEYILPDEILNVKVQIPSDETFETLNLNCRVKWSNKIESVSLMGVEITEIPPEYVHFYNVLFMNNSLKGK